MSTVRGIRIDADLQERLRKVADRMNRTEQWVIRTAMDQYLDTVEQDLDTLAEIEERWQEYLITQESVPNEEVMEWLLKGSQGIPAEKPKPSGSKKL
ncbi:MAG: transcriptional regulator [bacterium]|nr:transcriptional regulator [bacterium]